MQVNRKKNFRFFLLFISKSVCQRSFTLIRVGRNYYFVLLSFSFIFVVTKWQSDKLPSNSLICSILALSFNFANLSTLPCSTCIVLVLCLYCTCVVT